MKLERKIVAGGDPDVHNYSLVAQSAGVADILRAAITGCETKGERGDANFYRQLLRDLISLEDLPTPAKS